MSTDQEFDQNYFKRHGFSLRLALVLMLLNLAYYFPPFHSVVVWQGRFKALASMVLGLGSLVTPLVRLITDELIWLPITIEASFSLLILGAIGFGIGLMVEAWSKFAKKMKIVTGIFAILLLSLNSIVFGSFAVGFGNNLVGQAYASCEQQLAGDTYIRVIAYPEEGFLPSSQHFYLLSQDGGKTWKQFLYHRFDEYFPEPNCQSAQLTSEGCIEVQTIKEEIYCPNNS